MGMRPLVLALLLAPAVHALLCRPGTPCVCGSRDSCDGFQCKFDRSCEDSLIACNATRCNIGCTGRQSCQGSHIECLTDDCSVRCAGPQSCQFMKTAKQSRVRVPPSLALDPLGEESGIFTGRLLCEGDLACQGSLIGCASESCDAVCSGDRSCALSVFRVAGGAEGTSHRCKGSSACSTAVLDYTQAEGEVELSCEKTQSCQLSKVVCPQGRNCTVTCTGREACKALHLTCPPEFDNTTACHIDCVGRDSCALIGPLNVIGAFSATCAPHAGCSPFLMHATPNPLSFDTESPPQGNATDSPVTSVPGTVERMKRVFRMVMGVLMALLDRNAFVRALKGLLGDMAKSVRVYWTCPMSACTGDCPVSGENKMRKGCIPLSNPLPTSSRAAEVLSAGTVLEFGVEYSSSGTEGTVEDVLEAKVAEELQTPSGDFEQFQLESVSVVDTEVPEEDGTDGSSSSSMGAGYIALIVLLCVSSAAAAALALRHFLNRRQYKMHVMEEKQLPVETEATRLVPDARV